MNRPSRMPLACGSLAFAILLHAGPSTLLDIAVRPGETIGGVSFTWIGQP